MNHEVYEQVYLMPSVEDAIADLSNRITGVHEACSSVPEIGSFDFDQLVESITKYGLLRPIEIDNDGLLLDGRSRLQACMIADVILRDCDIVVTNADPEAIAAANNARRHLTPDQRAMEAARLLEKERKLAAQRKADGGKRGRQSRQSSHGTDSVPSETPAKKRAPRATEKVAAATGVSREKLAVAESVIKANPNVARQVEDGKLSLEAATEMAGVTTKRRKKQRPDVPETPAKKVAKAKPSGGQTTWEDEFTTVIDRPDGVRIMRCEATTFYIHKTKALGAIVMPEGDDWWWYSVTDEDQGTEPDRDTAEAKALKALAARSSAEGA